MTSRRDTIVFLPSWSMVYCLVFVIGLAVLGGSGCSEPRGGGQNSSDLADSGGNSKIDVGSADTGTGAMDVAPEDVEELDPDRCAEDGIDPVAGLAARCCLDYGADACGPGLFCAAYDGRSFAACYADHSRLDGESCAQDRECLSFKCSSQTKVCAASPNAACTLENGCGPGPMPDQNYVCAAGKCLPSDGKDGEHCGSATDCISQICKENRCSAGDPGNSCVVAEHCQSQSCVQGQCTDKLIDSRCDSGANCLSGFCVSGKCSEGKLRDDCDVGADCQSGVCVLDACVSGEMGSTCSASSDCEQGLKCDRLCPGFICPSVCTDGAIGSPCIESKGCDGDLYCTAETPWNSSSDTFKTCAEEQACKFNARDNCEVNGAVCLRQPVGSPVCGLPGDGPDRSPCTVDADCRSGICTDYGNNTFLCTPPGQWGAPCYKNYTERFGVTEHGCEKSEYECDVYRPHTGHGYFYGTCGLKEEYICKWTHNGEDALVIGGCAEGGFSGCKPYGASGKFCDNEDTTQCTQDSDCGTGHRCMTPHVCLN